VLDNFKTGRGENVLHVARDIELLGGHTRLRAGTPCHQRLRGSLHQAALPSVPRSIEDPLASNASHVTGTLSVLSAARDNEASRVAYACLSSLLGKTLRCRSTKPAGRRREILSQLSSSIRTHDSFSSLLRRLWTVAGSALTVRGSHSQLHCGLCSQDGGPPFTGTASSREILRT
jgi:hypothetical protein